MIDPKESVALMLVGLLSIALSRADKDNLMPGFQEGIRQLREPLSRFSQPISPQEAAELSLQQIVFAAVGWAFILIGILTCFLP
jgi:hypothetical protein